MSAGDFFKRPPLQRIVGLKGYFFFALFSLDFLSDFLPEDFLSLVSFLLRDFFPFSFLSEFFLPFLDFSAGGLPPPEVPPPPPELFPALGGGTGVGVGSGVPPLIAMDSA